MTVDTDELAQEIRRVDGNHDLGAGALAEALEPYLCNHIAKLVKQAYLEGWTVGWVGGYFPVKNEERVFPDSPPMQEAVEDWQGSEAKAALTPKQVADR